MGDDHWEIVALDVKMAGHAVIFKNINVKQLQRITEFHRISDSMTISEAYQLLEKGDATVSAENQGGMAKLFRQEIATFQRLETIPNQPGL